MSEKIELSHPTIFATQPLQSQSKLTADLEVIALLQQSLLLKANAGGAIKDKIREALRLLAKADSQ